MHIAGSDKLVGFYSLDAIISVGYRVKSKRGTQFRIWATNTLRSHLLKGFSLLLRMDGSLRLTDNAMVALALLIAESDPSQKDLMIRLTLNLLADRAR